MKVFYKIWFLLLCSVIYSNSTTVGGFIRFDSFYNSRQIVSAREGHFYLYPALPSYDNDLNDLNKFPFFNMTSFQTRIWMKTKQHEIGSYSVNGKVEVDFFGTTNFLSNSIRLRHSFIQLKKHKQKIIIGQFWSPMFTPDVFPGVLNFNTGVPFHPFARFPQISIYQTIGNGIEIITSATMQRDAFADILGRSIQQRAGVPAFHFHTLYKTSSIMLGGGMTQKTIRPYTDLIKLNAFTLYGKASVSNLIFKSKLTIGEDLSDHLMQGGLAQSDELDTDPNIFGTTTSSGWIDLEYSFDKFNTGLFFGYMENLGVVEEKESIALTHLAIRNEELLNLWRISPRISVAYKNLKFGFEYDFTEMEYNEQLDENYIPMPDNLSTVSNHRILLITMLSF